MEDSTTLVKIDKQKLTETIEYYTVDATINGKTLQMKCTVVDGSYSESIEGDTNFWNDLEYEEKEQIEDALEDHFNN